MYEETASHGIQPQNARMGQYLEIYLYSHSVAENDQLPF